MVRGNDDEGVAAALGEVETNAEGVVKGKLVPELAGDVVVVGGVVHARAFHLQNEALGGAGGEGIEGELRHLGERRRRGGHLHLVDGVGHVGIREEAQEGLGLGGGH